VPQPAQPLKEEDASVPPPEMRPPVLPEEKLQDSPSPIERHNLWLIFGGTLLTVIIITITGCLVYWLSLPSTKAAFFTPAQLTPLVQPAGLTAVPQPTPEPVNRSLYLIAILNGSGISSTAAKTATLLKTAGYRIGSLGSIKTATASSLIVSGDLASVSGQLAADIALVLSWTDKPAVIPTTGKNSLTLVVGQ
jgi:hypothetical protein